MARPAQGSGSTGDVPSGAAAPGRLRLEDLSPAERRVYDLALDGLSTARIAEQLVLTEATVRSHLTRIYSKLQVSGRIDLLARIGREPPAQVGTVGVVDAKGGRLIVWFSVALAAVGVLVAFFAPPVTILLGPALVTLGLLLKRRLALGQGWVRVLVLAVGIVLCAEALVIVLFVFGLLAMGT